MQDSCHTLSGQKQESCQVKKRNKNKRITNLSTTSRLCEVKSVEFNTKKRDDLRVEAILRPNVCSLAGHMQRTKVASGVGGSQEVVEHLGPVMISWQWLATCLAFGMGSLHHSDVSWYTTQCGVEPYASLYQPETTARCLYVSVDSLLPCD